MRQISPSSGLLAYNLLDTPPERGFDEIVLLASQLCEAPVALVSLLDRDRQWFKARVGFPHCETGLDRSVCRFVVEQDELIEIPDLTKDPRTASNPLVTGDPFIRFYAGAPLRTPLGTIGALCVIDEKPRPAGLTAVQRSLLEMLARQVVDTIELRRHAAVLTAAEQHQAGLIALGDLLRDERNVEKMIHDATAIIGQTLDASRAAYGEVDQDIETVAIGKGWAASGMPSIAGVYRFDDYGRLRDTLLSGSPLVITDVLTDERTSDDTAGWLALKARSVINVPVRERGRTVALLLVHHDHPHAWTTDEIVWLRNAADRIEVATARRRAEERQVIINGEIIHRLKNTLAMVQSIAGMTLRKTLASEELDRFDERLRALGRAHDLLHSGQWQTAELSSLATGVLESAGAGDRRRIAGPPVQLGASAAMSAALVLHELATNASKYGSLSVPDGIVDVSWRIEEGGNTRDLVLDWSERNGPPVVAPTRRGFGSRLVSAGLLGTGGAEVRYGPSGLAATFRADVEKIGQVS